MIPKTIHYCWFGRGEKSKLINKCIKSWKKYCPDYEIVEWNEDNFDVNQTMWTKEAYESKKWAFVSDYVRLYALYNYGGIYCDTDVEIVRNIDDLLKNKGFSGFEKEPDLLVQTGIIGAEKGLNILKSLLSYYDERHFVKPDGTYDTTTNTHITTDILEKYGFIPNGKKQSIDGFVLYPKEYFAPKDFYTGRMKKTKNTACIHHYNLSWIDEEGRKYWDHVRAENRLKERRYYLIHMPNLVLLKLLGDKRYNDLKQFVKSLLKRN